MAQLDSTNQCKAVLKKGASWNTEADITSGGIFLFANNISVSGGYEDFRPRDFGTSGKRTKQHRIRGNFTVNISCDITFGQAWLTLLGALMGTESVPAEQTVGEGDYLHNFDLADSILGMFHTLVYKVETDKTRAFPSLKVQSCSIESETPGVGTAQFSCIADEFIESSANTASEIDAVAATAYEAGVISGSAAYFRYDAYSTGSALTNADDKPITRFKMDLSRPMQAQHALRGASSGKCYEPSQQGDIEGMVEFTLYRLAAADADLMADWYNASTKMAELFFSGSQIGAGVNRSLKFSFPYLQPPGEVPQGQSPGGNNQYFTPTLKATMLKAPAAAAGMAGFTDYLRVVSVDGRSTKWTS